MRKAANRTDFDKSGLHRELLGRIEKFKNLVNDQCLWVKECLEEAKKGQNDDDKKKMIVTPKGRPRTRNYMKARAAQLENIRTMEQSLRTLRSPPSRDKQVSVTAVDSHLNKSVSLKKKGRQTKKTVDAAGVKKTVADTDACKMKLVFADETEVPKKSSRGRPCKTKPVETKSEKKPVGKVKEDVTANQEKKIRTKKNVVVDPEPIKSPAKKFKDISLQVSLPSQSSRVNSMNPCVELVDIGAVVQNQKTVVVVPDKIQPVSEAPKETVYKVKEKIPTIFSSTPTDKSVRPTHLEQLDLTRISMYGSPIRGMMRSFGVRDSVVATGPAVPLAVGKENNSGKRMLTVQSATVPPQQANIKASAMPVSSAVRVEKKDAPLVNSTTSTLKNVHTDTQSTNYNTVQATATVTNTKTNYNNGGNLNNNGGNHNNNGGNSNKNGGNHNNNGGNHNNNGGNHNNNGVIHSNNGGNHNKNGGNHNNNGGNHNNNGGNHNNNGGNHNNNGGNHNNNGGNHNNNGGNSKDTVERPTSYAMTPVKAKVFLPSTQDDYNIRDLESGDSSDDEYDPRKVVPLWARSKNLIVALRACATIPIDEVADYFGQVDLSGLDLMNIFVSSKRGHKLNKRTSSACWDHSVLKRPRLH